ncbi:MAG: Coenzyme F420 hydrogenase/dehydrogenase, beta subunit C-terminal domain [Thermoguttaceae bacterium]|nr:Coenzyme F420 hydrogenase/dehydrogenase, beta subunit C-terminal domain [Thermoguttaceae bacterium]
MSIKLCNQSECTGCGLCAELCPNGAITMAKDLNGFSYPKLAPNSCSTCGRCRSLCPVLSHSNHLNFSVPESFACWAKDTVIRKRSSSGGLFSIFANHILAKHGVVYGVIFDAELKPVFSRTESETGLTPMCGSKYIEANTNNLFSQIATDLNRGGPVLFSGTPCQNAALKNYVIALGLPTSSLYQIDLICHGVSSPALWESFIRCVENKYCDKICNIYFRDKSIGGWKSPSIRFKFKHRKDKIVPWSTARLNLENAFITCYHKNLTLRSACAQCRWTGLPREGDITLADAQALYHHPDFRKETRDGISMILINSSKGKTLYAQSVRQIISTPRPFVETRLPAAPVILHPLRESFLLDAQRLDFSGLMKAYRKILSPPFRFATVLKGILQSLLGPKLALSIREAIELLFHGLARNQR